LIIKTTQRTTARSSISRERTQPSENPEALAVKKVRPEKSPRIINRICRTAENDDRLRGVKTHGWPLVDQKENDSGDPAEEIRKQGRDLLIHLRAARGHGRDDYAG
jgi:hypothetical protein